MCVCLSISNHPSIYLVIYLSSLLSICLVTYISLYAYLFLSLVVCVCVCVCVALRACIPHICMSIVSMCVSQYVRVCACVCS